MDDPQKVVILISAGAEWRAVLEAFPDAICQPGSSAAVSFFYAINANS